MGSGMPEQQGLYSPSNERDACGLGFVAHIKGKKSHQIVQQGLQILANLTHRGATGYDPKLGDGAGILIQMPDAFMRKEATKLGINLPAVGSYACGTAFLPQTKNGREACESIVARIIHEEAQTLLGWRDVSRDNSNIAQAAKNVEPVMRQVFIGRGENVADQNTFERKLFVIRKRIEHEVRALKLEDSAQFYFPSLSSKTIIYKGMLLANEVGVYYTDLNDPDMMSALALVHQRFSTNTFPAWDLAHPFRMIAHNGEINTVQGNINWMAARHESMRSALMGEDLEKLWPLIVEGQSDSAAFDNALELLVAGGYSLPHAMMMLIPEAWSNESASKLMDEDRRAFYEYHAALMEPWDGPAAVAFTDGTTIGATLDRNGLRPARYLLTDDDHVMMASEMGVLTFPEEKIIKKWRLQPGKMLLINLEEGRIIDDAEIKKSLAEAKPYKAWIEKSRYSLADLPKVEAKPTLAVSLLDTQQAFGYTQEDLKFVMQPMIANGEEASGSMGNDSALSVLSNKPKIIYNYFKQLFAQVTNPPIDPIREELVMSLVTFIGPKPNLLGIDETNPPMRLEASQPVLNLSELEQIKSIDQLTQNQYRALTLDITYPVAQGKAGMAGAIDALCAAASKAVHDGINLLILSDRAISKDRLAIPALLATSATHQSLVRAGLRTSTGLVVDTGSAREVHHFALLGGYGAEAVCPWLAFQSITDMVGGDTYEANKNFIKAISKGLHKVMSKMGISTYQSYCGAQIFEAIGLNTPFIDKYFTGTATHIEGIGLEEVSTESFNLHTAAFGNDPVLQNALDAGGEYAYRVRGEEHMWTPDSIAKLQQATRTGQTSTYKEYAKLINDQSRRHMTLRSLFEIKSAGAPVPLEEVESAKEIVKRFATGAMSLGSISTEAHATLAIAMNRIGGKSNTGEGGEDPKRFISVAKASSMAEVIGASLIERDIPLQAGDSMRSKIKQVASGRFGVTAEYLANADQIQIKMAQGAKPGEGGELPGFKVTPYIAENRMTTPGVGLISPPPHHDIYSIEDLAQLIHDLKNAQPKGEVSVKLVSEVGVGVVAAGVAKAKADHITISGGDGGTGAAAWTGVKGAGLPWELGLAEAQQTLVINDLRSRVRLQTDGQLKTGRDVIIAAMLGAEEFGFATAPLIALGCIMMRKCHLNTCPVGVATQDPLLRKKFSGKPEHVVNFFFLLAEEMREYMAELGVRSIDELVGRTDLLEVDPAVLHYKSKGLDLSPLLTPASQLNPGAGIKRSKEQDHELGLALDNMLLEQAKPVFESGVPVKIEAPISNLNRTVGTMLSYEISKRYGKAGLPDDSIHIKLTGHGGQSLGFALAKGVFLDLEGDSNDYVGKGLSGGKIAVYPHRDALKNGFQPKDNVIVGNVCLYGATSGKAFFRGKAGERFAVRNSGAISVVEGVGDHGAEYMTGGRIVVIGETGRNFAAGMSGGIAYVHDPTGTFPGKCNMGMVGLEKVVELEEQEILKGYLKEHIEHTDSSTAKELLEKWPDKIKEFVKVMPHDYKRVLQEQKITIANN